MSSSRMYKWYWLLKEEEAKTSYLFIYRNHKRVAYLYSGTQGAIGVDGKLGSSDFKPIDTELELYISNKCSEGYVDFTDHIVWTEFNFSPLLSSKNSNEALADEVWDMMEILNEELFKLGLSINEGYAHFIMDSLTIILVLFDKEMAYPIIKTHFDRYFESKGLKMWKELEKQLLDLLG